MRKTKIEAHFDKVARSYDTGKHKYAYYYGSLKKLLGELIPKNKNVLEIGCGTGDLLASLRPKEGYGYDISTEMIKRARTKYKNKNNLHFFHQLPGLIHKSLDAIFMSDVIEHLENPGKEFAKIAQLMGPKTIFVITMANPIWEPLLMIWERLGLKMEEGPHTRHTTGNLKLIIKNSKLRLIKHDYKLLIPVKIPLITSFANKYLEKYLKKLAFIEYFVVVKS